MNNFTLYKQKLIIHEKIKLNNNFFFSFTISAQESVLDSITFC